MAVQKSTRPDISESIPLSLGRAGARAARESTDKSFSIGIGGIGFNLRANGAHPYMREADQVRKDQFDASDSAGEQSLGTWWRRSQNDWSMGEGAEWYEPAVVQESANRYFAGQGVDPWTQGRLTLLHSMEMDKAVDGADPVYVSTYRYGNEDGYVIASGDTISYQGPNLSGSVRTNHLMNPRFFGRPVDGTTIPASGLATGANGGGRIITFSGSTGGVTSFTMGTHPGGTAGLNQRQSVSTLPPVWSFAANFRSLGTSSAAVLVKYEMAFYDDAGNGIGANLFTEEARVGRGETRRFTLNNKTIPENAHEFRVICFVRKESEFEFSVNMQFEIGPAIIEAGGIVGDIFNGSTPDTSAVDYEWVGTAQASKSTKVVEAVDAVTLPAGGLTQPAVANGRVYYGRTDAVGFVTPGSEETVLATCTGQARAWWVKSRLFVAVGQKLYWVNHAVNGQTIPDDAVEIADGGEGWEWVDVADTPDAILMAGHDGTNSYVFAVTVSTDSEGLPEFTGAAEVARMPYGERITCMGTYLGTYVALGTTLGIRIGLVGQQGRVQYGPILKRLTAVEDVSFYDSFAYFSATGAHPDGSSGLWRVDLSTEIADTGRNPYASDLYVPSASRATSVAFFGGSGKAVMVAGQSVYLESEAFVKEGWVTHGKVRFRTTANKDFQSLYLSGVLNGGTLDHRALVPGGTEENRIMTQTPQTGLPMATLDVAGGPLFEWMQLKTYITPGVTAAPEIHAWTLAAIPQPERSRLIRYPLQVADYESGRFGAKAGYEGFAFDRIQALESLEDTGSPILVEDSRTKESFIATIESIQFTSVDNGDGAKPNLGGWLDVTVRKRS